MKNEINKKLKKFIVFNIICFILTMLYIHLIVFNCSYWTCEHTTCVMQDCVSEKINVCELKENQTNKTIFYETDLIKIYK